MAENPLHSAVRLHINSIIDKPDPPNSWHGFHSQLWREVDIALFQRCNRFSLPSDFAHFTQTFAYEIINYWLEEHYTEIVEEMTDSSKPSSIGEFWFKQRSRGVEWWVELF